MKKAKTEVKIRAKGLAGYAMAAMGTNYVGRLIMDHPEYGKDYAEFKVYEDEWLCYAPIRIGAYDRDALAAEVVTRGEGRGLGRTEGSKEKPFLVPEIDIFSKDSEASMILRAAAYFCDFLVSDSRKKEAPLMTRPWLELIREMNYANLSFESLRAHPYELRGRDPMAREKMKTIWPFVEQNMGEIMCRTDADWDYMFLRSNEKSGWKTFKIRELADRESDREEDVNQSNPADHRRDDPV